MALYREAVCLYKAVPAETGRQLWVVPLSARYHTQ
jgi:hypothetical protein